MSVVASDLCSPDTYAGLFRKHTERVARACGGCFIHHHMHGFAVHKEIVKTDGLRMTEISLDPNKDRPAEHLKELIEQNAGIPLMLRCSPAEVREHIDLLKQGTIFVSLDVGELDEAEEAVRFIRKNSKL
jgi:hypothetical protein